MVTVVRVFRDTGRQGRLQEGQFGQARPPQKAEIAATFSAFLMVLFLVPDRYDKMVVLADQSFNRMRMSSAMVGNMATHVRGCRFC